MADKLFSVLRALRSLLVQSCGFASLVVVNVQVGFCKRNLINESNVLLVLSNGVEVN